jgi:hypothetical protein
VAFFCGQVREVFEREALVLVDAVLFELSAKLVFERVARAEDGTSDG